MTKRPFQLAVIGLLAAAAAACGSSGPTPTSAVNGVEATPTLAATTVPAPTQPAGTSAPLASFALPSFDLHAAPDLEAKLPSTIGTQQLQKYSFSFAQLGALGGQENGTDQTFQQWLQVLGKNPSDVTMAVAYGSASASMSVGALKVNGTDQATLVSTFQEAASKAGGTVTTTTLGGKQVVKLVDPQQADSATYVYAKGDTMFFAQAPDDATAATMLQALP